MNRLVANEINTIARYCDRVIQWLPRDEDNGLLLAQVDAPQKQVVRKSEAFPDITYEESVRTVVLVNGTFNHHYDIQSLLTSLKSRLSRTSRVVVVLYNPYLSWLYRLANWLGLRKGEYPTTFLTRTDLGNLATISGFAIVRQRNVAFIPLRLFGLGDFLNRLFALVPMVRWLALTYVVVLRPIVKTSLSKVSISCVVPARNERGNIENALTRLPDLGCPLEMVFVEGHSSDGTWEEILRVAKLYGDRCKIQTLQQTGKGKVDAVRLGFAHATGSLLVILDADLTMPPEMLSRFLHAYCEGYADFINGSRLVYPMEGEAMRFLNLLGNKFYAKALSWVLDVRVGDTLCGTKMLTRGDYQRVLAWRRDFGDFDPFGDYELLFPAAVLGLGIADIPIRYLARTYGETNIHRFRDGLLLLKMTWIGLIRIKFGTLRN